MTRPNLGGKETAPQTGPGREEIQLLSTHGIFMTPTLGQAPYWVLVSWRCAKRDPLLSQGGGGIGHVNK